MLRRGGGARGTRGAAGGGGRGGAVKGSMTTPAAGPRRQPSRCPPPRARRRPRGLTYAGGSALDASRHRGRDMTILLVVALLVGLLLPLELLGLPPSWRARPAVPGRTPEPDGEDVLPATAEDE